MINLYEEIKENYNDVATDGYSMERFKSLPFRSNIFDSKHAEHNSLVSTLNSQVKDLSKAVQHILKNINSEDYTHAGYGVNEVYKSFKREQNGHILSKRFSSNFSQLATLADEVGFDYTDLADRLSVLCKTSNNSFLFFEDMAKFINEYAQLEPYLKESYYNKEEFSIYVDEVNDLVKRHEKMLASVKNYEGIDYSNVIAPQIREFEIIQDDMLFRIKENSPDSLFNMSEFYHRDISNHAGDLASFMLEKKYKDTILSRLTLSESQKIQDFIVFADASVCYKKGGVYQLVKDKQDHRKIFSELEHSIIAYQLRKKPKVAQYMSKLYTESGYGASPVGSLNNVLIVINTYLNNEQILKNMKLDLTIFENKSFEAIDDHMNDLVNKHKLNQYANSILSNKNKHLLNDNSLESFKVLMDSGISKSVIQSLVGKKLSAISSQEEFEQYLEKVVSHVSGFSEDILMDKLNGSKITPVYNESNVVVFEIDTFEQSQRFGSPSWCIARTEYYFNDYKSNANKQYFMYDFNRDEKDNESMIGFTVKMDGSMRTQHARNDDYHEVDDFLEKIVNKIIYTNKDDYKLSEEKLETLEKQFNSKNKKNLNKVQSI